MLRNAAACVWCWRLIVKPAEKGNQSQHGHSGAEVHSSLFSSDPIFYLTRLDQSDRGVQLWPHSEMMLPCREHCEGISCLELPMALPSLPTRHLEATMSECRHMPLSRSSIMLIQSNKTRQYFCLLQH